jgi:phosphoglucomutase
MTISELAGHPAPRELLVNVPRLISAYYTYKPDPEDPTQQVSFGTSGHRGSSLEKSFNEDHILAVCQAICEYRRARQIDGPLFLGMDTHALSEAAHATAIEVFAAHDVDVRVQSGLGYTPTPVISHAILTHNRSQKNGNARGVADGVVITPSHNPPADGGFKYNPPKAGPADTETTRLIQARANEILQDGLRPVRRVLYEKALASGKARFYDFLEPYIMDLKNVVDLKAISDAHMRIGVDPLGGAAVYYWDRIAEKYHLNLEVVNCAVDPTFSFMTVDWDGKIRMDCSSPYAMAGLIELKDRFDIAFGNDSDVDRHGIVTPSAGLLDPNHYLAVAIWYLFTHRPGWSQSAQVGKTVVSSYMIDKVAQHLGRPLCEVPVGFKWFVDGLIDGSYGFGGEESAGASFLRMDGTVWTTDKDGIILGLLAAEIAAVTGSDPGRCYKDLEAAYGASYYNRFEAVANSAQKTVLTNLSAEQIPANTLGGYPITAKMTRAPGNQAPIGGLKVTTEQGWFAARPSGTEDVYKIYAESLLSDDHLQLLKEEAQAIVSQAFREAGA